MSNLVTMADALADADVFTDGDWVESKDQDPDGDVRLTQLADVGDGSWIDKSARFLTSEKAEQLRCTYLEPGDLLVARMPDPLGRCCVFPGDPMLCVTVVDVCVIRPNQQKIDNRYLMHVINSPHGRQGIARYITGTTRQRISRKNLGKVAIPLPPLPEQKRIAGILDAADALRARRHESLAQLDTLLQSTFLDMFGDPIGSGWEIATVEDVARNEKGAIRTGPFGSQLLHSEFVEEGIRVLGIDNAVANEFRNGEPRFITTQKYEQLRRYTVQPGDILITIMGTCGRCAVVPDDVGVAINTKHLCCITLDQDKCLPAFMHAYFLEHPIARRYLERSAKGAIMSGLNMGIIKALPIPVAPLDLQHRFASIVESVEQQKASQRAHLAELDTLFASLQSRAFNGEL